MTLQLLKTQTRSGAIDTIIVAFPDIFGRLVGKRFRADFFLDHVAGHGTHGCNYLLTVNLEMDPLDGFKVANWESGFGDFELRPDLSTMRALPWQPGTVLVICDYLRHDGSFVEEAPRSVLRRQLERLRRQKLTCYTASELEFFLFNQSFHDAFAAEYRNLTPSSDYRIDYQTMQPTRDEALFRAVRNGMTAARVPVESSKGEWGRGQHEVNFIYDQPLPMADMHVVFKQGMKEMAAQHGKCVTFMPKPWATEVGSSCHIHASLWRGEKNLFWNGDGKAKAQIANPESQIGSRLFRQFLGGLMKYSPELCYFLRRRSIPTSVSAASWAPTKMAWSHDNRTVGFRVVGKGKSFVSKTACPARTPIRISPSRPPSRPALPASKSSDCGADYHGNAYVDPKLHSLPKSLGEAADLPTGASSHERLSATTPSISTSIMRDWNSRRSMTP
jgi:glutamine synthetase